MLDLEGHRTQPLLLRELQVAARGCEPHVWPIRMVPSDVAPEIFQFHLHDGTHTTHCVHVMQPLVLEALHDCEWHAGTRCGTPPPLLQAVLQVSNTQVPRAEKVQKLSMLRSSCMELRYLTRVQDYVKRTGLSQDY